MHVGIYNNYLKDPLESVLIENSIRMDLFGAVQPEKKICIGNAFCLTNALFPFHKSTSIRHFEQCNQ